MASLKKEEASQDLPYGHFGAAEYNCDHQRWIFQRTAAPHYVIKPWVECEQISQPSLLSLADVETYDRRDHDSVRRAKQIADLITSYPETQPAAEILDGILQVAEAAEYAASVYEPLQGRLLGFGRISTASGAQVVAFPTGPTGSDLRLRIVSSIRCGWPDDPVHDLEVPSFDGDEAIVKGQGSAIQQIRFSQPQEDDRILLAVRYLSSTRVFRPILSSRPSQTHSISRLDAVLLAEIEVHQTGGASHVDVALNPFSERQFALIDQDGAWSVWDLPRKPYEPKCVHKGTLDFPGDAAEHFSHDQWAKIDWVLNPDTLMIVTRYRTRLVFLNSAKTTVQRTIEHGSAILDASILPLDFKYVAVLTCTHLEVWDLEGALNGEPILSVRHFRSVEDPSLKMSVFPDEKETIVLLQSHLSKAIQVLRLNIARSGSVTILSDPVDLGLERLDLDSVRDIHLSRLQRYGQEVLDSRAGSGFEPQSQSRIYSCTILTASLVGFHTLCHALPHGIDDAQLTLPVRKYHARKIMLPPRRMFVVDNGDNSGGGIMCGQRDGLSMEVARLPETRGRTRDRSDPRWTMNYSITASHIRSVGRPVKQSLRDVLEHSRTLLDGENQLRTTPTLADALQDELTLQDLDESSVRLQEFSQNQSNSQMTDLPLPGELSDFRPVLRPITLTFSADLQSLQADLSISAIYHRMIGDWIAPLNPGVHSGTRLAKEQIIRKVAVQLALATQVIRREQYTGDKDTTALESLKLPESSGGVSQWELPVRTSADVASSRSKWSTAGPTFPLTPTTSASMITSSSMQSISQELHRLGAYTSITRTMPTIGSRAVGSVLSHWHIGEDPASYNWTLSSRRAERQAEADELEDADLTEKERARMQRRAERHLRRQRREAAASEAARRQSSQAPAILSASQPQIHRGQIKTEPKSQQLHHLSVASSQTQATSQDQGTRQTIASQVQPGRFGGRPIERKRKRKSGF